MPVIILSVLWRLSDGQRNIILATVVVFAVTQIAAIILMAVIVHESLRTYSSLPLITIY